MTQYYIRVDDLANAHGSDQRFAWMGQSPQNLAQTLERALRDAGYINQWRDAQAEPDEVSAGLLAVDAHARVTIEERAQRVEMQIVTLLPHKLLAHRMNLLIGAHWTLGDVK